MSDEKLSRDAWVAAGFRALAKQGPGAVQINYLARSLGTTKGSFYWHFKDMGDFKHAMLTLWRTKVATEVIEDVTAHSGARTRLEALFANAACAAPDAYGGRTIEPAMRAWALLDAEVAGALRELDDLRIAFVAKLLQDLGIRSPALTQLVYGAYIGLDDLQSWGRADISAALDELKHMILASASS